MIDIKLVCPECGYDMSKTTPEKHALTHFPEYLDPAKYSKLSRLRHAQILKGGVTVAEYEKAHKQED